MTAYNHEKFIPQAIESVMMQEADFRVELVIGEDCSTDGTRRIVQGYAEKYPDRIRLLQRATNLGMNVNVAKTLAACNGEYVALLEGDDYWTDPRKLARQAAFLDSHPECASCFHNAIVFSDEPNTHGAGVNSDRNGSRLMCRPRMKTRFSQSELLKGNVIPTCSVMFRRAAAGTLPPWFEKLSVDDLPLHVICAEHGPAAYLNDVMGAYRLHPGGYWSSKPPLAKIPLEIGMYEELERYLHSRPRSAVVRKSQAQAKRALSITRAKLELARARQLLESHPEQVPAAVWRAWRRDPRHVKWLLRYLLVVWPKFLGGRMTARIVHQKIRGKWQ